MKTLMNRLYLSFLFFSLMALSGAQAHADLIYATASNEANTSSVLGTLNLSTGAFTEIGAMSVVAQSLTADANGTLYAGGTDGHIYTVNTNTGATTQFGTVTSPTTGTFQNGFYGLAYAGSNGFYAATLSPTYVAFGTVSPSATSFSSLGLSSLVSGYYYSGTLAIGPNGTLYTTYGVPGDGGQGLYSINTTTGAATEVGPGFGSAFQRPLGLVTSAGTLYGFNVSPFFAGPYDIFTLNTSTGGVTNTGVAITGLPTGFQLDAAADVPGVVPEPSSFLMMGIGSVVLASVATLRHRRVA